MKSLIIPAAAAVSMFAAACASGSRATNARPITGVAAVAQGDCVEARRRAAAEPDLAVDLLPNPVKQSPAALARVPANVKSHIDRNGAVVKGNVLIDTLGRPDMKTFRVDTTSHPWLAENFKSVIPKWKFTPARLAGCKVARVYKFSASRAASKAKKG